MGVVLSVLLGSVIERVNYRASKAAKQIAELRKLPIETIGRVTSDNFETLFAGVKA